MKNLRKRTATDASMARVGSWPSAACIVYLPGGDSSWRRKPVRRFCADRNAGSFERIFSKMSGCAGLLLITPIVDFVDYEEYIDWGYYSITIWVKVPPIL
jgi:hypothetical protein